MDGGGAALTGARTARNLPYFAPDLKLMSVDVTTSPVFQAVVPKAVFKSNAASIHWDSTADGQRFLVPVPLDANSAAPCSIGHPY